MKFWAQIRLSEGETPQQILVAFFKEFKPGSAIQIQEKNISIEVDFDENSPPEQIPQAIGGYANIQFSFGKLSENFGQAEKDTPACGVQGEVPVTQVSDVQEGVPAEQVSDVQEEVPVHVALVSEVQEEAPVAQVSDVQEEVPVVQVSDVQEEEAPKTDAKKVRKAPDKISEIDTIAEKCISYMAFAEAVANWLELTGKRKAHFVDLAEVAATVKEVKWMTIETELIKKGYHKPIAARQQTSRLVTQKLTAMNINCSLIALIEYVAKFNNVNFISERVKKILTEMGIEKQSGKNQKMILEVAELAANRRDSENQMEDIYGVIADRYKEDVDVVHMIFSNFVRRFYGDKGIRTMTVIEFITKFKESVKTGETVL